MKVRLLLAVAALHVDVAYGTAGIKIIAHQGHGCTGTQSWSTFTAAGTLDHDNMSNPIQADDNVCTSAGVLGGEDANGGTYSVEVYIKGSCCAPKEKFKYAFYLDAACTDMIDDEVTEATKEVGQTNECVNHGSGSTARSQNFTCTNVPDSCRVTEDNKTETEILPGFVFTIIFVVLGVVVLGLLITCAVPKLRSKAFECCGCAEQDKAVV